jgi:hypothetical protein
VDLMRHAERAPRAPLDMPRADLLSAAAVTNSSWLVQTAGVTVLARDEARGAAAPAGPPSLAGQAVRA